MDNEIFFDDMENAENMDVSISQDMVSALFANAGSVEETELPAEPVEPVNTVQSVQPEPPASKVTVRAAEFGPLPSSSSDPAGAQSMDLLLDVALRVSVELGRATMAIKDILGLGPGSVIELDKLAGEAVDIMVNDRLIARGEVVVVDENFGVRVTDIVNAARRNAATV